MTSEVAVPTKRGVDRIVKIRFIWQYIKKYRSSGYVCHILILQMENITAKAVERKINVAQSRIVN